MITDGFFKREEPTVRERQVAQLYAQGRTNKQIAKLLNISPATVRNHIASLYRKLGVNNKIELSKLLMRRIM